MTKSATRETADIAGVVGKNAIINGNFDIWQRGTSFAAIANTDYFADRWRVNHIMAGAITASRAADSPTAAQAGIYTSYCISSAVTTADTSIAAADFFSIQQLIEGLNTASFGFGQAGSRNVTLSFWVKGTKTGIHCVSIRNSATNRQYAAEYTIDSTNTWEYKTITIPVDTTGTWLYDTGMGLAVSFVLAAGTNYHITANTWTASTAFTAATSNQVNALDNTSNIFKVALVQLEAGSVATEFEPRSVGQELALCERYYEIGDGNFWIYAASGNTPIWNMQFTTTKRAVPTIVMVKGGNNDFPNAATGYASTSTIKVGCGAKTGSGAANVILTFKASAEL